MGLGNGPSRKTGRLDSIESIKRRKVSVGDASRREAPRPSRDMEAERENVKEFSHTYDLSNPSALATPSLHWTPENTQLRSSDASQGHGGASAACFLIPYREYDWTSSPSSYDDNSDSSADGDSSTASPSQLENIPENLTAQFSPILATLSPPRQQTSPIDLTSPTTSKGTPSKAVKSISTYQAQASDPGSIDSGSIDLKLQDSVFVFLRSLPAKIFPPPPPTGDSVQPHITRGYAAIATKLPIHMHFRPVSIVRDMHHSERGYWALPLKIIHDSVATEGRASDVWRQSDFANLYRSLQKHITGRTSDWSVRAFLEVPSCSSHVSTSGSGVHVTLKTTCYAQVIPHVFLLLWILSEKNTGRLGMCWYGADNQVVVRMGRDRLEEVSERKGAKRGEKMFRGKMSWQSKENGFFGAFEGLLEEAS
ncbi:MAG: hypothetical protein Q9160_002479 [Pyrenula sp. 1 TL-2023]